MNTFILQQSQQVNIENNQCQEQIQSQNHSQKQSQNLDEDLEWIIEKLKNFSID